MKKIRVGAVNYLNTKPLLYGIKHHPIIERIALVEDYPSNIAAQLIRGSIDVGLIPVAATQRLASWEVVSNYCIGCDGEVASVCLFSQVPMQEIQTVYLDYQSRTSVALAKILLNEYWRQPVHFVEAVGEDFRDKIEGAVAGVVIGDRALEQRHRCKYIYDLGTGWKDLTGLPFVFAAWVGTSALPNDFQREFDAANALGLLALDTVIQDNPYPPYDLSTYYRHNISYRFDDAKRKAMDLFLSKLRALPN